MLCRTLFLILISAPLCAGGGILKESAAAPSSVEESFHNAFEALQLRKAKAKEEKQERKQNALKGKKQHDADDKPRPVLGNRPAGPEPLEQIPEEDLSPQEGPDIPEQPQVAPQQPPGFPQASRGGGSLLGLATVGLLAVCYNGYQNYRHKRPSHNILNEKDPSKAHRPIFTQQ